MAPPSPTRARPSRWTLITSRCGVGAAGGGRAVPGAVRGAPLCGNRRVGHAPHGGSMRVPTPGSRRSSRAKARSRSPAAPAPSAPVVRLAGVLPPGRRQLCAGQVQGRDQGPTHGACGYAGVRGLLTVDSCSRGWVGLKHVWCARWVDGAAHLARWPGWQPPRCASRR